jgi:WD40 repeat protein
MALAVSPDGRLLASADSADTVRLWDLTTNQVRHVLEAHKDQVLALAFSPDGRRLASGGSDRVLHLWDTERGELVGGEKQPPRIPDLGGFRRSWTNLAVDPGGMRVASTGGGSLLQVWEVSTGRPVLQVNGDCVVHSLAYSPDGRWLLGGGADARVRVWDAATGALETLLEDDEMVAPVTTLAFPPRQALLAAGGASGTEVWLWDVATGEPTLLIPDAIDGCAVEAVAFHPDGRLLAVAGIDWLATGGSDGAVALWDVVDRCEVALFDGGATCAAFHPSGRWLASASLANSICVWDMTARQLAHELVGHDDTVTCVAYSPDGRWLASSSDDRTVRLWDAQSGKPAAVTELDTQAKVLTFSPDGRYLFTSNGNTTGYQLDVLRLLGEDV